MFFRDDLAKRAKLPRSAGLKQEDHSRRGVDGNKHWSDSEYNYRVSNSYSAAMHYRTRYLRT